MYVGEVFLFFLLENFMRLALKIGIISSGLRAYQVAAKLDWSPSKISAIIAETYDPTAEEMRAIAEVLGRSIHDLFPESNRCLIPDPEVA